MREFRAILEYAQNYHAQRDEPIPSLTNESEGKIDSCLNAPFATVFGTPAFKGFFKKATALFYYIAKGHPLGNGNKRMACMTTSYFCAINGWLIRIGDEDLVNLAKSTASSMPEDKVECMKHIEKTLKRCAVRMQLHLFSE